MLQPINTLDFMATNFTPLNVQKFRGGNNSINTVLLLIATLTTFILVILLFILIQKKATIPPEIPQKIIVTPTVQVISPSPTIILETPTPEVSPSGKINISPTKSATGSPTISP